MIFYDVIKYSPSLTYLHVAVPINLNSFKQEKEVFKSFLTQMSQNESEATQNDTKTIRLGKTRILNCGQVTILKMQKLRKQTFQILLFHMH
jgi:hypothetical protein